MSSDKRISIEVYQHDWIPGFAAFHANGKRRKGAKRHVVLNLGSLLTAVKCGDLPQKDLPYMVAETLMHEVIHALEEWAGVEFNEERVEELLQKYQAKYAQGRRVWKAGKPKRKREKGRSMSEQTCPDCGGSRGFYVTQEMAADAGDLSMSGVWWECRTCDGSGVVEQTGENE